MDDDMEELSDSELYDALLENDLTKIYGTQNTETTSTEIEVKGKKVEVNLVWSGEVVLFGKVLVNGQAFDLSVYDPDEE